MRLLVTRPREDAESFARTLAARGIETLIEPMIEIVDRLGPPLARDKAQAVLFTSVNGVRALQRRNRGNLAALTGLPVLTVGDATARAAQAAGFRHVESASGDVVALAALVLARLSPQDGPLIHIAGSDVAGDLAGELATAGFLVNRVAIYTARKVTTLSAATVDAFHRGTIDGVTFFSPRTAAAFVTLGRESGVLPALAGTVALCLSPAVARAAGTVAWRAILVAPRPDQEALLGCVDDPALQPARSESGSGASSAARERT
jgi:uroporphyrinogen-III synthase